MYGPKGFFQYQSVVPREVSQDVAQAMLKEIADSGDGSLLAVLKTFGNRQPVGMLSFPQSGRDSGAGLSESRKPHALTIQATGYHRA